MILLISTCKNKLHENEFVKPIEKILKEESVKFQTKHYLNLSNKIIESSNKIIICGTSLSDDEFLKNINKFSWIKKTNKSILGICAGAQIIAQTFNAKTLKKTEIGFFKENFKKDFLGERGEIEVYHLHNNYATLPEDFEKYTKSKISQAIKHKTKPIYATLFHPEVRNKNIIKNFINSK